MEKSTKNFLEGKIEFYNLMSMVFMKEPTDEFCDVLKQVLDEDYFPMIEENQEMNQLHNQLRDHLLHETTVEFAEKLKKEYYDLFFDPHGLKASPWQSSYTSHDHLLFQLPDYETKAFYRKYGYQVTDPHLPGDHISIELDFLKRLSEKELVCLNIDKLQENTTVFEDNIEFIDKYLLVWIDLFISALAKSKSIYYHLFASMIKIAGELDKTILTQYIKKEKEEED